MGKLGIIGPHIGNRINVIADQLMIGVKGQRRLCYQIAACVIGQHRLCPFRHPAHGAAQGTGSMGDTECFGIAHGLHPETTAHIRVGDAQFVLAQPKVIHQIGLRHPDTLPVHSHMQTAIRDLCVAAARLHCVTDDAVVGDIHADHMGGGGNRRIHGSTVAFMPFKRFVLWGLGVDGLAADHRGHMGWQVINL